MMRMMARMAKIMTTIKDEDDDGHADERDDDEKNLL